MLILDANVILRYLLNDNQEMADKAEVYLESIGLTQDEISSLRDLLLS